MSFDLEHLTVGMGVAILWFRGRHTLEPVSVGGGGPKSNMGNTQNTNMGGGQDVTLGTPPPIVVFVFCNMRDIGTVGHRTAVLLALLLV